MEHSNNIELTSIIPVMFTLVAVMTFTVNYYSLLCSSKSSNLDEIAEYEQDELPWKLGPATILKLRNKSQPVP